MSNLHDDHSPDDSILPRHTAYGHLDNWKLTDAAFNKLLVCLSPDREEAANRYETPAPKADSRWPIKPHPTAEDHADEIINRVARKIDEGAVVPNVFAYAFGVAKMVLREVWKESERIRLATRELPASIRVVANEPDDQDVKEPVDASTPASNDCRKSTKSSSWITIAKTGAPKSTSKRTGRTVENSVECPQNSRPPRKKSARRVCEWVHQSN